LEESNENEDEALPENLLPEFEKVMLDDSKKKVAISFS
jgi:hypothetical protein